MCKKWLTNVREEPSARDVTLTLERVLNKFLFVLICSLCLQLSEKVKVQALRVEKSFKKFYGRYQDLIEKYQRSVNVMVNDSFPG